MEELVLHSEIGGRIITLRGEQVMLDRDLAELYGVTTKRLNEQVKRNRERFPDDFMFQLSEKEFADWRSQNATSNADKMGLRRAPYAFTEQGIYMLASVLKSPKAIEVNIAIIRTFKRLREFTHHYNALAKELISIDRKHEKYYRELKKALDELAAEAEAANVAKIGFLK